MSFLKWDENTLININSIDEVRWKKYGLGYEVTIEARHRECILSQRFGTLEEMNLLLNNFEIKEGYRIVPN